MSSINYMGYIDDVIKSITQLNIGVQIQDFTHWIKAATDHPTNIDSTKRNDSETIPTENALQWCVDPNRIDSKAHHNDRTALRLCVDPKRNDSETIRNDHALQCCINPTANTQQLLMISRNDSKTLPTDHTLQSSPIPIDSEPAINCTYDMHNTHSHNMNTLFTEQKCNHEARPSLDSTIQPPLLERLIQQRNADIFTNSSPIQSNRTLNLGQLYFVDDNIFITNSFEKLEKLSSFAINAFTGIGLAFNTSKLKYFEFNQHIDDEKHESLLVNSALIQRCTQFTYLGFLFVWNGSEFKFTQDIQQKCENSNSRTGALMMNGFRDAHPLKKREIFFAHIDSIVYRTAKIDLYGANELKFVKHSIRKYSSLAMIPRKAPIMYFHIIFGIKPPDVATRSKFLSFYHHTISGKNHRLFAVYLDIYTTTKQLPDFGIQDSNKLGLSFKTYASKVLYALRDLGLERFWDPTVARSLSKKQFMRKIDKCLIKRSLTIIKNKIYYNRHNILKHLEQFRKLTTFDNTICSLLDSLFQYGSKEKRKTNHLIMKLLTDANCIVWNSTNECKYCGKRCIEVIHLFTNCERIRTMYGPTKYNNISREWLNIKLVYDLCLYLTTNDNSFNL
eukprot:37688_1